MAITLEDFYTRVLRELKVVPPNGTASSEDRQRVVDAYPDVHAQLLDMELVQFGVTESIPNKFVLPMIKVVAFVLTSSFSVPPQTYMLLKQEGELEAIPPSMAERQLRKRMDTEYVSEPIKNDFI